MTNAHGHSRLKWSLDWPVTVPRSGSGSNNLSMSIPSVKVELVVLGCAIVLGLVLVTFHAAFGF